MFLFKIFFFVIQIYYCMAASDCKCPEGVIFPIFAVYLIGIVTIILFFTTVALAVKLFRSKDTKASKHTLFGNNRHVSISKYHRQVSGSSQRSFQNNVVDDETVQLNMNEVINDDDFRERDDIDAAKINEENEIKSNVPPQKIARHKQPKFPIFPQMEKEQMDELCKAVLSKHRLKESTSLSDLDKIINDAKEEKIEQSKIHDISASTPILDGPGMLPSASSIKNFSIMKINSKESKLQDELEEKINNSAQVLVENGSENQSENKQEIKLPSEPKLSQNEINAKLIHEEMKSKQDGNKSKTIQEDMVKFNQGKIRENDDKEDTAGRVNEQIQEDLYDCPPPPRPQNEIYDFPPSPKPKNELYDFPPKNTNNDMYDFPSPHRPQSELYDIPPSPRPHDETYECPPKPRNIIVRDDDASGYLLPISDGNIELFKEPQYCNAKSMTDLDLL